MVTRHDKIICMKQILKVAVKKYFQNFKLIAKRIKRPKRQVAVVISVKHDDIICMNNVSENFCQIHFQNFNQIAKEATSSKTQVAVIFVKTT